MDKETLHAFFIAAGGMAAVGKLFLMAARTIPPPPPTAGFWQRWFYDFIQIAAENQDRAGKSQDPDKPVGQAKQTLSASATTVDTPKGVEVLAVKLAPSEPKGGE